MYVVYVNHPNNKAIVHRDTCRIYVHRRRNETHNGCWEGPFESISDARNFASSTGKKRIDVCAFCLD